jgi:RNA polymerase sigma-70 factor (ECF subfamily)
VDEAALLRRARQGDEFAFGQLFASYQRPLYRYASRMCGDAADDVVQETFMIVLRQQERFDPSRGTFGAYVFGVARHVVLKQLGNRYEIPLDDDTDPADETDDGVLAALSQQERVETVRAAVRSLPPAYREVVALCELEEMDYADAARIIGCPIGTVRSRLHRARALLLSKLASLREATRS